MRGLRARAAWRRSSLPIPAVAAACTALWAAAAAAAAAADTQRQAPPQRPGMPSALPSFGLQLVTLAARANEPLVQPPASASASAEPSAAPDRNDAGRATSGWAATHSAARHGSSVSEPSDKENVLPGARPLDKEADQLRSEIGSGGCNGTDSQVSFWLSDLGIPCNKV